MTTLSDDSAPPVSENSPMEKQQKKIHQQTDFFANRPGHLSSEGVLQIKTLMAQRHFLSMLSFAKQVKTIYRAARRDDPYADAYLLQIETQLETTQGFIREKIIFYEQSVPSSDSLLLPLADTKKPLALPVRFTTPYGYIAARVLVEFDRLVRSVISLHQFGLLADSPLRPLLNQLGQPLYQLWKTTRHWKATGLTRTTIMEAIAAGDEETYKALDPGILHKTRRAKYAPPIIAINLKNQSTEQKEIH
jgi:integrating conjugative element protein (TIGR03761 family)